MMATRIKLYDLKIEGCVIFLVRNDDGDADTIITKEARNHKIILILNTILNLCDFPASKR